MPQKIRLTILLAESRTRSSRDLPGENRGNGSSSLLRCKEAIQSFEHLYPKCRKWRKERRKLVREQEKEGVIWQPQVERRWLAGLLANEKAVAPLLGFLKTTGVGGREGARERELEWGRRNDRAGEDLLE